MNSRLLRFPNPHFKLIWCRHCIDFVTVTVAEAVGAGCAVFDYL